ncbi:hypothetical protein AMTRI_Chr03g140340 [Amborella trichopoda]
MKQIIHVENCFNYSSSTHTCVSFRVYRSSNVFFSSLVRT